MTSSEAKVVGAGKFLGKSVALVGKFGYSNMYVPKITKIIEMEGGAVVEADQITPDVLVIGDGRGGKPPSEAARIQKKAPTVLVLDLEAFYAFVAPTADELLASLGSEPLGRERWEIIDDAFSKIAAPVDLTGTDFRGLNLSGAKLDSTILDGCDFRSVDLSYAKVVTKWPVIRSKFDDANLKSAAIRQAEDCTFKGAGLEETLMDSGRFVRCDFSNSGLSRSLGDKSQFSACLFVDANLSEADLGGSHFHATDFTNANLNRVHASKARLDGCVLVNANLGQADLRNASLVRADLRNANLREAVLNSADLTGANVDGADFQDAVLTSANLTGLDASKALNFRLPTARVAGPKLTELAAAAAGAQNFTTFAEVDLGAGEFARLEMRGRSARTLHHRGGNHTVYHIACLTFEQGMFNLADRWPNATLRLDTVEAKGSKSVRGKKLLELAQQAWAEVFGVVVDPEALKKQEQAQRAAAVQQRDQLLRQMRVQGAAAWNAVGRRDRERYDLCGVDLSGANLGALDMHGLDLRGSCFVGTNLTGARLWGSKLQSADFSNADLKQISLTYSNCDAAKFVKADLTEADLRSAKLQGADFSEVILSGAKLEKAQFDETTVFPTGFTPPADMIWKGEGPRPGADVVKAAEAGTLDFDTFLKQLNDKVESARMQKAGSMLKAERFQLFAEVDDDAISGVVKSQSSSDLVYSCRLTSAGAFSCCTQNLRPCGGLRGALCKHLLVLIVGLAKAGRLDSATVDHWIDLSRGHKPAIDDEANSAIFLRYKGAEAGEVDWRPTETIPEDFYAM